MYFVIGKSRTKILGCVSNGFRLEKLRRSDSANGNVKDCFLCRGAWSKTELLRLLRGIFEVSYLYLKLPCLSEAL